VPAPGRLVELDGEQCWRLLRSDTLGRIVYTYQALPAVVPVNYAVLGESVLVRTSPRSRLGQLGDGVVVAFEVDSIDRARRSGWSVVLVGAITVLEHSPEGMEQALHLLGAPWTAGAEGVTLRIMPGFVTGRDVRRGS
jgi:nitroimidazol reductase NimA-like FMN-containing flavoprotein (pyridoxamine 5'-phosphate oxidase superfamily)